MVTGITFLVPLGFLCTEVQVYRGLKEFLPGSIPNVAQLQFRADKEIARIHIPVILNEEILTAVLLHLTNGVLAIYQVRQEGVEPADGDSVRIPLYPLVKNLAEKIAPLVGGNGEGEGLTGVVEFHAWNVLVVVYPEIAEITVDLSCPVCVGRAHQDEGVEFHIVPFQALNPLEDIRMRPPAGGINAVTVVYFRGSVDADANEESVLRKVSCHFVINEGGIGLQSIGYYRTSLAVFLLKLGYLTEELYPHEGWLTALPPEVVGRLGRGHVTRNHSFEYLVAHTMTLRLWIKLTSVKVETVCTAKVAISGGGFYEKGKRFALLNTITLQATDVPRVRSIWAVAQIPFRFTENGYQTFFNVRSRDSGNNPFSCHRLPMQKDLTPGPYRQDFPQSAVAVSLRMRQLSKTLNSSFLF